MLLLEKCEFLFQALRRPSQWEDYSLRKVFNQTLSFHSSFQTLKKLTMFLSKKEANKLR